MSEKETKEEKILVTQSSLPPFDEYVNEIKELWDSHWLTNMGAKHNALENSMKDYLEVEGISLMTNGHMALEMGIQAMNLTGEVITTPFTFASTTHAIARNGLKPVFCDINPEDYTIDCDKIEELITDRTTAILPVHVYGNVCDVNRIQKIADKYGLKVIYDAAHAFGVKYFGKGIASYGDASMFSFHATKVFNTIEGGAVCFADSEYGLDLYRLKNFGIRGPEVVDAIGANAKMNEFQAAMGICNLRHLTEEIEKRKKIVEVYKANLSDVNGVVFCNLQEGVETNYAYLPVLIEEQEYGRSRNELVDELAKYNIFARKYFYPITNTFKCYDGAYEEFPTPVALHVSHRILTLPLYADLPLMAVERICDIIRNFKA